MERTMKVYGDKVYGVEVSNYGLENSRLDYQTLSHIVGDSILNNDIMGTLGYENWQLENGAEYDICDEEITIYQYYIISDNGARFLIENTDEIVYYNYELDLYLWGITHYGTGWSHVLTNIKLV